MTEPEFSFRFDKTVNNFAVDNSGRYVTFGGKKGLYIVDLDDTKKINRSLYHKGAWDIILIEWNPHNQNIIASAANQDCLIWDLDYQRVSHSSFRAHTRSVSDIAWSPFKSDLLATCSADTFIHLWDLREHKKNKKTQICPSVGTTRIKWNRVDSNLLASSHGGIIRIWDIRKYQNPERMITAHNQNITGIDWSYQCSNEILTCAGDSKIKFWTLENTQNIKEISYNTGVPLFRAQYTPFGSGVVGFSQRSDYDLRIWYKSDFNRPPILFKGHDIIISIAWRKIGGRSLEGHQLLSWGKDQRLCIWNLSSSVVQELEQEYNSIHDNSPSLFKNSNTPISMDDLKQYVISHSNSIKIIDLEQEFSLIKNTNIPGVIFHELNTVKRSCVSTIACNNRSIKLRMTFPSLYPNNAIPSFEFIEHNLNVESLSYLKKMLEEIAQYCIERNNVCLEMCLRQISVDLTKDLEKEITPDIPNSKGDNNYISDSDDDMPIFIPKKIKENVPFPRLSGATFSGNGMLVYFKNFTTIEETRRFSNERGTYENYLKVKTEYFSNTPLSLTHYFYSPEATSLKYDNINQCNFSKNFYRKSLLPFGCFPKVKVYNMTPWLGISRTLATTYTLKGNNVTEICKKNENAARAVSRKDLIITWQLLQIITHPSIYRPYVENYEFNEFDVQWAQHPFGRPLVQSLIEHYEKVRDIQTLAMIICVLSLPSLSATKEIRKRKKNIRVTTSNEFTYKLDVPFGGASQTKLSSTHDTEYQTVPNLDKMKHVKSNSSPRSTKDDSIVQVNPTQSKKTSYPNIAASLGTGSPIIPRSAPGQSLLSRHPDTYSLPNPKAATMVKISPPAIFNDPPIKSLENISPYLSEDGGLHKPQQINSGVNGHQIPLNRRLYNSPTPHFKSHSQETINKQIPIDWETKLNEIKLQNSRESYRTTSMLLDPDPLNQQKYTQFCLCYADILNRWGLFNQRVEVLQFITNKSILEETRLECENTNLYCFCSYCKTKTLQPHCNTCTANLFQCSICNLYIKGLSVFCFFCGHGGHPEHIRMWFSSQKQCPIEGCMCSCFHDIESKIEEDTNTNSIMA